MKTITLTQNKTVIVDDEDFDRLNQFKWYFNGCKKSKGYARRNFRLTKHKRTAILMHREILNITDSSIIVDHINGNRLDNRKNNLRIANPLINAQNSSSRPHSCDYIGVGFFKKLNKWRSRITVNKQLIHIGYFSTAEDARDARTQFIQQNQLFTFRN